MAIQPFGMFAVVQSLRTPGECFADLPEFPYAAKYCDVSDQDEGTLRVAWVEHGPAHTDPVLMLHGEPSWSFLYRRMTPILVAAGHRVICPDLVGFGRSDKPTRIEDHTYARHVEWMRRTYRPLRPHRRRRHRAAPRVICRCPTLWWRFPEEAYKVGARAMPGLIPTSPDDPASEPNRAAWKVLSDSATPMLDAGEELAAAIVQFLSRPL